MKWMVSYIGDSLKLVACPWWVMCEPLNNRITMLMLWKHHQSGSPAPKAYSICHVSGASSCSPRLNKPDSPPRWDFPLPARDSHYSTRVSPWHSLIFHCFGLSKRLSLLNQEYTAGRKYLVKILWIDLRKPTHGVVSIQLV